MKCTLIPQHICAYPYTFSETFSNSGDIKVNDFLFAPSNIVYTQIYVCMLYNVFNVFNKVTATTIDFPYKTCNNVYTIIPCEQQLN